MLYFHKLFLNKLMTITFGNWYKVFAWWPIKTVTGKRLWLTTVYVREALCKPLMMDFKEYGTLFDVIRTQDEN